MASGQSASSRAQFGLGGGDALGAVDLGEAAGEHRLGLVIERAQELRLPAVPHPGPDRANVGGGEDGQKLHPLQRLHHGGEILDRLAVGQIARLRHRRHDEVDLDQPGDQIGVGRVEARAAGRPAARCARRRSNDPRSAPWRCRAGTSRHRARRGAAAGSCASARWQAPARDCRRARSSSSSPMQRIRCSSTV